ncbi:MAG: AAA family ATPase [Planctomycetes bacterium]|nr:AAA family ATPase [Planctomycetota bacterium]
MSGTAAPAASSASGAEVVARIKAGRERILSEVRKAIIGQEQVVDDVVTSFFAGGHCLITGVPGLAKTLLIASLGKAMDLNFRRVQFTPDLMPADITGTEVLEEDRTTGQRAMSFRQGPVFTNILLADEINRTPPKTQAALLEAMQENQVTVAGTTYQLPKPFFVLATQNPVEQEGTYPLPEVQQDRFMFSLIIDYLPRQEEVAVINATTGGAGEAIAKCIDGQDLIAYNAIVRQIPIAEPLLDYAVRLAAASRPDRDGASAWVKENVSWGASVRASHYLVLGAKARAVLAGRPCVGIEDIRSVALPVLRHRIVTNFRAESAGIKPDDVVRRLLADVPAPGSKLGL